MKTRIILVGLMMLSLAFQSFGQTTTASKILVADETYFQPSGKSNFKVISSNDIVVKEMITKFSGKYVSYSVKQQKDRKGKYWVYTLVFPNQHHNLLASYLNSLNKNVYNSVLRWGEEYAYDMEYLDAKAITKKEQRTLRWCTL